MVGGRAGKVQLINAADLWKKIKKSLGSKRKQLGTDDIDHIVKLHDAFEEGERVRILDTEDLGYTTATGNRPLGDKRGNPVTDEHGKPKSDPMLVSSFRRAPTGNGFFRRHAA